MRYIYATERKRMEKEFKEMADICQATGMTKDQLEDLHRFMLDQLNSDRRFYTHTQSFDGLKFPDDEEADEYRSPLLKKFLEQFSVTQGEICDWSRFSWTDDIDTPELVEWLKMQSEEAIEFLTLLIMEEMKQFEVAQIRGCSEAMVSKHKKCIFENIKSVLPERIKKQYEA